MGYGENLHPAKFKNVTFFVPSETVKRGKKVVVHEYPNSNVRYVEELGKLPPMFTLPAIVHGQDALAQRLRLEQVLEEPGQGELVHPVYGPLQVTALTFTVDSDQTKLGVYEFSIEFAQSRFEVSPVPDTTGKEQVTAKAAESQTAVNDNLEKKWLLPAKLALFADAVSKFLDKIDEINAAVNGVVDKIESASAAFTRTINTIQQTVFGIVTAAADLKQAVQDIVDSVKDLVNTPAQLLDAWRSLAENNPLDGIGGLFSSYQKTREQNNATITEHLSLTALINLYESVAYTDYDTDLEIEEEKAALEELFKRIVVDTPKALNDLGLESVVPYREMLALRNEVRKVLDEKEKAAFKVTTKNVGRSSMLLTTYKYYGGIGNLEALTTLNYDTNSANFKTDIKLLSNF